MFCRTGAGEPDGNGYGEQRGRFKPPSKAAAQAMGDGYGHEYDYGRGGAAAHPREVDNRRARPVSNSPEPSRKFRFVEAAEDNAAMMFGDAVESPTGGTPRQVRKSPPRNPMHESPDEHSPNEQSSLLGPTERYQKIGEDTPTSRGKWTEEKEIILCGMWEDAEHLYNAALDDHRRNDRRREAIRRIAARIGLEGMCTGFLLSREIGGEQGGKNVYLLPVGE